MVTIQEALQQTKAAEASADVREKDIRGVESQFAALGQRGTIKEQLSLAGGVGVGGVGRELFLRRGRIKKEKRRGAKITGAARQELGEFRASVSARRSEIEGIQARRKKAEEELKFAELLASGRGSKAGVSRRVRKLITQIQTRDALIGRLQGKTRADPRQDATLLGGTQQSLPAITFDTGGLSTRDPQVFLDNRTIEFISPDPPKSGKIDSIFLRPGEAKGIDDPRVVIVPDTTDPGKLADIPGTIGGRVSPPKIPGLGGQPLPPPSLGPASFGSFSAIDAGKFSDIQRGGTVQERVIRQDAGGSFASSVRDFSTKASDLLPTPFTGAALVSERGRRAEKSFKRIRTGVIAGLVPKTKSELAVTAITLGTGTLIGGGLKLGGLGLKSIGATRIAAFAEKGVGLVGLGLGGAFVLERGQAFVAAPDLIAKGEVIGSSTRELGALGAGVRLGGSGVSRVQDVIRTRGLTELPAETIIAPEFFAGQRFPSIRRGETAGQLRSEFFEPVLPGEAPGVARGFTARTESLPGVIPPSKGKRGELVGLFQAPRVSPAFLRIAGEEQRFIGVSGFLGGATPSVARVTPTALEFAPGVFGSQKAPRPLRFDAKVFSEQASGTGKSIIPFSKTEKEAIIPLGTAIESIDSRFFFRFEGRRVPIGEFKTTGITSNIGGVSRIRPGARSIESTLSSSGLGRRAPLISSEGLVGVGRSSSLGRSLPRSSSFASSGFQRSSFQERPSRPRSTSGVSRSSFPGRSSIAASSSISRSGISGLSGVSRSSFIPLAFEFGPTTGLAPLRRGRDKPSKKKKKKTTRGRFGTRVAPSFTAQVFNIRGSFPKEVIKGLGLAPGQLRVIPR